MEKEIRIDTDTTEFGDVEAWLITPSGAVDLSTEEGKKAFLEWLNQPPTDGDDDRA